MSQFPESALIEAGFLRRRCSEAVNLECPVCGTVANDLSLADCTGGMTCGTCGQSSAAPRSKCARCKEMLSSTPMGRERECLSLQAYRSRGDPAAFAPEEPLWAFKRETSGAVEVAAESDLKRRFASALIKSGWSTRRFASGELDSSALVRGVDQPDFIKADACPEFREVARPRPAPEPVNPLWEYKALVGSVGQTARQSELVQWFLDGRLDAETLVRKNGRGIFVLAGRHPLFTSIARPRAVPQPATPSPPPPRLPPSVPVPPVVPGTPPPLPTSSTGSRWGPAVVGAGSFCTTCLVGFALDRAAFLGSQVDNMAATFIPAAFIAFLLYCLARGTRGNTRMFARALVVGGLLWLAIGVPLISMLGDPKEGSKVLVHAIPLSWCAGLPDEDRKALLGFSILVMPFIAGFVGSMLAIFGARNPGLTRRSLLPIYVVFIGLGLMVLYALRSTSIGEETALPQAIKQEAERPDPIVAAPLQPKTTVISLVSSRSSASFRLVGPQTLSGEGSTVFSNVLCGIYKIVANTDGLEFESSIDATSETNHLVEYKWQDLKIRVESPEVLTIYFNEHVLGTNTAKIRAPVGKFTIALRGEGTANVKVRSLDGDWGGDTWRCVWNEAVTLDLADSEQIVHRSGVLRGLVRGLGFYGKSTYELFVERE
jgi:hypothetical protein